MKVAIGNCPTCGLMVPTWTPEAIVKAMRDWNEENGGPPKEHDWTAPGYGHPSSSSVRRCFGSWKEALTEAGLEQRINRTWTKEGVLTALLRWRETHGEWPKYGDWTRCGYGHPTNRTVERAWGSFSAAVVKAQSRYRPPAPVHQFIPTAPLARLLRREMRSMNGTEPQRALAKRSGVTVRTIYAVMSGERKTIQAATADKLLCAVGRPDAWHNELAPKEKR